MSVAAHRFSNDLRYRASDHENQTQFTPPYVIDPVSQALGGVIELDPCNHPSNPTGAARSICLPEDGLADAWGRVSVYVNPPYGKAREPWVARCIEHGESGSPCVLLMPSHSDTKTFQRAASSADWVVFVQGRVKFGVLRPNRRQQAASHPSAIFGWNANSGPLTSLGLVMTATRRGAAS